MSLVLNPSKIISSPLMSSYKELEEPIFSNDFVKCYSDHLVINLYYFPYGNKTIKYKDIQSCEFLRMKDLNIFKCKNWGMALSPIWWHCDLRRFSREYYILIQTNQWPQIGLTMDDQQIHQVYQFIEKQTNKDD